MLTHLSPARTISESLILTAALRGGKVVLPVSGDIRVKINAQAAGPNLSAVLHSQLELEALGFVYGEDLALALSWMAPEDIISVVKHVEKALRTELGAHHLFKPMYPNFPKQVLDAADAELLVNAWMHYLGDWLGVRILPRYTEAKRTPLLDKVLGTLKPTVLALGDITEYPVMLGHLVESNASLSQANRALLVALLEHTYAAAPGRLVALFKHAAEIPQRETCALIGAKLLSYAPEVFEGTNFIRYVTTPTDILRLAAGMSTYADVLSADYTLTVPATYIRFSRAQRRMMLACLDRMDQRSVVEEMALRREQWLRLGEFLHPGEYRDRYPRAFCYFSALRKKDYGPSWQGGVEDTLGKGDIRTTLLLLKERPGVFARKLHEVLRKAGLAAMMDVLEAFAEVAHQVSTPVLLQAQHRLQRDIDGTPGRAFAPKAGVGRIWVPQADMPRVPVSVAAAVVNTVEAVLLDRFAQLPALGKVYVDPALDGFMVPFAQRTAQKALKTVARGSRVALGDERVLRAFLWWSERGVDKNGQPMSIDRTDLDLSCAVLDPNYQVIDHCSFTRLRSVGLTHSGDITSAPKGACEFIDIDFSALPKDAAYIALLAYAYTPQNFGDLPEAYMGWMARADQMSGEIYDARTVRQKIDLTAAGQRLLVGYVDVQTREFIWADLVLPACCSGFNAVETSTDMLTRLAPGILHPIRPSLGNLFGLHAVARGKRVDTPEEADVAFLANAPALGSPIGGKEVVTAFDGERIAAEFLA